MKYICYLKLKTLPCYPFSMADTCLSERVLWKYIQGHSQQVNLISKNKVLLKSDFLERLSPFLDQCGVLRVGGRIDRSDESYASKHPLTLPVTA